MLETQQAAVTTARWNDDAEVAAIRRLRDRVTGFATSRDMPDETVVDLGVAVSEAVTNCVRHAYPDGERGEIAVDVASDHECLTVRVADHGAGSGGSSLGLGVKIMRGFADRLEIRPRLDGVGTIALMEFSMLPRRIA